MARPPHRRLSRRHLLLPLTGLAAVLPLVLAGPSAQATTMLKVGVPDLTRTSEWIVRAQVKAVRDVDLRAQGRSLFTDVDLQVLDVYRGAGVPATYALRLPGGQGRDGVTMMVPGMPRFRPGDEVVLFLEKTSLGHIPCGLTQGVWRVLHTPSGLWVRQARTTAHVLQRTPKGAPGAGRLQPVAPKLLGDVRPLDDLLAEIYANIPAASPSAAPTR